MDTEPGPAVMGYPDNGVKGSGPCVVMWDDARGVGTTDAWLPLPGRAQSHIDIDQH